MSIFYCFQCDGMADADDGCSEGPRNNLICADCTDEMEAEREEADMLRGEPLDPWADAAEAYADAAQPLIRHDLLAKADAVAAEFSGEPINIELPEWLLETAKAIDALTGAKHD